MNTDEKPPEKVHLEDHYPEHDQRLKGWKLIGFDKKAKPSMKNIVNGRYPYGKVPVWKYLGWDMNNKYNADGTLKRGRKNVTETKTVDVEEK